MLSVITTQLILTQWIFYFTLISLFVSFYSISATANALQQQLTSFVWITDIHLDPLYHPKVSGRSWCRPNFNSAEWTKQQKRHSHTVLSNHVPYGPVWHGGVGGEGPRRPMTAEMSPTSKDNQRKHREENELTLPAYWGRYGCDAPPAAVNHCFKSIINTTLSHISTIISNGHDLSSINLPFVVVTGDLAAHYWEDEHQRHRWDSLKLFTSMIDDLSYQLGSEYERHITQGNQRSGALNSTNAKTHDSNSQIIITVGNNDLPEDYVMEEWDNWAENLYEMWSGKFIPSTEENKETFIRGMYYWTPIRSVPNLRAICLNTMWWSQNRPWTSHRPEDPAGQLSWLRKQLADAKKAGDQVLILGHIPAGYSYFSDRAFSPEPQWYNDYEEEFLKLVALHRSIILVQMFGHFHSDDLRVQRFPLLKANRGSLMENDVVSSTVNGGKSEDFIMSKELKKEKLEIIVEADNDDDNDVSGSRLSGIEEQDEDSDFLDDVPIEDGEDFRSAPIGAALLSPSIGTTHGNNPAFRILDLVTTIKENVHNESDGSIGINIQNEGNMKDDDWITVTEFVRKGTGGGRMSRMKAALLNGVSSASRSADETSPEMTPMNNNDMKPGKPLLKIKTIKEFMRQTWSTNDVKQMDWIPFDFGIAFLVKLLLDGNHYHVKHWKDEMRNHDSQDKDNDSEVERAKNWTEDKKNIGSQKASLLESVRNFFPRDDSAVRDEPMLKSKTEPNGSTNSTNNSLPIRYESTLIDYIQFIAHLHSSIPTDLGTYSPVSPPLYVKEYAFRELYSQPNVMYQSVQKALVKIRNNDDVSKRFWRYHNAEGGRPAAFFLECYQSISQSRTMKECITALMRIASGSNETGDRNKIQNSSDLRLRSNSDDSMFRVDNTAIMTTSSSHLAVA